MDTTTPRPLLPVGDCELGALWVDVMPPLDAEPLGGLLWQAAAADAAILTVGVLIGVLIGRGFR